MRPEEITVQFNLTQVIGLRNVITAAYKDAIETLNGLNSVIEQAVQQAQAASMKPGDAPAGENAAGPAGDPAAAAPAADTAAPPPPPAGPQAKANGARPS